jgi:phage protein D
MISSLLSSSTPTASTVRRPAFTVSFGAGGPSSSGLGGREAAVGGALGVDLSGGSNDPWQQHSVTIALEAHLAPIVDGAVLQLSGQAQSPPVALGDQGSIGLGYSDAAPVPVFTGQIESLRHQIAGGVRLTATNGGATLAKLRVNQSYEQQTAGDIVKDLVGRTDVETDTIEDGLSLPFYVVDDRRSVYQQIADLAQKSGYLAYFTAEGKLKFSPAATGDPVQTFTYGVDILQLQVTAAAPVVAGVTAIGEGAAGSEGQAAWSWLVKDPAAIRASAGTDPPTRLISDAALRSQAATQTAATSRSQAASQQALTGRLWVPGAPAVGVGSPIAITNAPQDSLNGTFLVRGLSHRYSKAGGFTTLIEFTSVSAGESGLAGLLGGLG